MPQVHLEPRLISVCGGAAPTRQPLLHLPAHHHLVSPPPLQVLRRRLAAPLCSAAKACRRRGVRPRRAAAAPALLSAMPATPRLPRPSRRCAPSPPLLSLLHRSRCPSACRAHASRTAGAFATPRHRRPRTLAPRSPVPAARQPRSPGQAQRTWLRWLPSRCARRRSTAREPSAIFGGPLPDLCREAGEATCIRSWLDERPLPERQSVLAGTHLHMQRGAASRSGERM